MRTLLAAFLVCLACGAVATLASAGAHITFVPDGLQPGTPVNGPRVACDVSVRYDDGSDDTPGSGPTLGWYSSSAHQYLGVKFTPTGSGSHRVQSAGWFSDFWVVTGLVNVTVYEEGNPSNTDTAQVTATEGFFDQFWEVDFPTGICIPEGGTYVVMICPLPPGQGGGWGVVGDDYAAPDNRSYWTAADCSAANSAGAVDYMIWSCVTACGAVPTDGSTWGNIKSLYR